MWRDCPIIFRWLSLDPEPHLRSARKEHILHIPYQSQSEYSAPDTMVLIHLASLKTM